MIRHTFILYGLMLLAGGCASSRQPSCATRSEPIVSDQLDRAVSASALLFDAPMYGDDLPPELARDGREPTAFVAYEDQTTTFSYVHIDDQQLSTGGRGDLRDRYERRAIIDRFGTSTR